MFSLHFGGTSAGERFSHVPDTRPILWCCRHHRPCTHSSAIGSQRLKTPPTHLPTHIHSAVNHWRLRPHSSLPHSFSCQLLKTPPTHLPTHIQSAVNHWRLRPHISLHTFSQPSITEDSAHTSPTHIHSAVNHWRLRPYISLHTSSQLSITVIAAVWLGDVVG